MDELLSSDQGQRSSDLTYEQSSEYNCYDHEEQYGDFDTEEVNPMEVCAHLDSDRERDEAIMCFAGDNAARRNLIRASQNLYASQEMRESGKEKTNNDIHTQVTSSPDSHEANRSTRAPCNLSLEDVTLHSEGDRLIRLLLLPRFSQFTIVGHFETSAEMALLLKICLRMGVSATCAFKGMSVSSITLPNTSLPFQP